MNILKNNAIDLEFLRTLTRKPALFTPSDFEFWADPYMAKHIIDAHLDPDTDAASRKPETIQHSTQWIAQFIKIKPSDHLLDLGCGPGLYCQQFVKYGCDVTGIDLSPNCIDYADKQLFSKNPAIKYLCQDYLKIDFPQVFDVITLIYGNLCTHQDSERDQLLKRIYLALKPGGVFVFDVFTKKYALEYEQESDWFVTLNDGFWSPKPHLVLTKRFHYAKDSIVLNQYTIISADGSARICRIWHHYYTRPSITRLLKEHGFEIAGVFADLEGTPFSNGTDWIGIVAKRPK
jgi:SAM-dependent methyltransferase